MQNILLILMSSTAVASLALTQSPPPSGVAPAATATQTAATPADCDRLETFLEQRHPANPGVTLEQVRSYRTSNNVQACHDALMRLDPNATQTTAQGASRERTRVSLSNNRRNHFMWSKPHRRSRFSSNNPR